MLKKDKKIDILIEKVSIKNPNNHNLLQEHKIKKPKIMPIQIGKEAMEAIYNKLNKKDC